MNLSAESVVAKSGHVVSRIVDGEAVIVEPKNALVNVVNSVGSTVWELLDGKRTIAEIADIIVTEYEVPRQQALANALEFLDDMQKKELVVVVMTGGR